MPLTTRYAYILILQVVLVVQMEQFVLLVDSQKGKEQYRYVLMGFGDMCAVIAGTQVMPEWYAASWDTPLHVSSVCCSVVVL